MKTALIHDWFLSIGGAEKSFVKIHEMFPGSIFTLLKEEKTLKSLDLNEEKVSSSFIDKLPFSHIFYRDLLPLFPLAIKSFDLSSFDLILSSSHCVAKGVHVGNNQLHICYCHTPMRYAWDMEEECLRYQKNILGIKRFFSRKFLHYLRRWDYASAKSVDFFIANSYHVAKRIEKYYGRPSHVIYPPVAVDTFSLCEKKEDYYLVVSRLVPYKRIDLIIEAFSSMPDKKLIILGDGPEKKKLKKKATPNVFLLGGVTNNQVRSYMQKAKATIFASYEDFGIVPVESMASGTPVIAYGKGGVTESSIENKTTLFFFDQNPHALKEAILQFEKRVDMFDPVYMQEHAKKFSEKRFQRELKSFVLKQYDIFCKKGKKK